MADNREKILEAYKIVFNGPHGQVILRDLEQAGFANRTTLVPGDPHASAANEGSRRLYLLILSRVRQANSPIAVVQEIQEW